MSRDYNTTVEGEKFPEAIIETVWNKGKTILGQSPDFMRVDCYGFLMCKDEYGNLNSVTGWEIDHIIPVEDGGLDILQNLQPLQWRNNRKKSTQAVWESSNFRKVGNG